MSDDSNQNDQLNTNEWVGKIQDMFQSAQTEIKKATQLGAKLVNASQSSTELKLAYEELGRLSFLASQAESPVEDFSSDEMKAALAKIRKIEKHLESIEEEVQNIKKSE